MQWHSRFEPLLFKARIAVLPVVAMLMRQNRCSLGSTHAGAIPGKFVKLADTGGDAIDNQQRFA